MSPEPYSSDLPGGDRPGTILQLRWIGLCTRRITSIMRGKRILEFTLQKLLTGMQACHKLAPPLRNCEWRSKWWAWGVPLSNSEQQSVAAEAARHRIATHVVPAKAL